MEHVTKRLTPSQLGMCFKVGLLRQGENEQAGRTDRAVERTKMGSPMHCEGAVGEFAVADWTGQRWWALLVGQEFIDHKARRGPDVGEDIEVKTVAPGRNLIIRDKDPYEGRAVLTYWAGGLDVVLVGWVDIAVARQPKYWDDVRLRKSPAYLVPVRDLLPMEVFAR